MNGKEEEEATSGILVLRNVSATSSGADLRLEKVWGEGCTKEENKRKKISIAMAAFSTISSCASSRSSSDAFFETGSGKLGKADKVWRELGRMRF